MTILSLGLSFRPINHIEALLNRHHINLIVEHGRRSCSALVDSRAIILNAEVTTSEIYAVALHEIGHLVSRNQNLDPQPYLMYNLLGGIYPVIQENEIDAWRWAKHNAMWWTYPMDKFMVKALSTYEVPVERIIMEGLLTC